MHGVARGTRTAQQIEADQQKFAKYRELLDVAMERRKRGQFDRESLAASAAALHTNIELYTLWNFRREVLQHLVPTATAEEGTDARAALLQEELALTERAIKENPKSYWVWLHRRWCGSFFGDLISWKRELGLCDLLLSKDQRNFHCWGYRRWVTSHLPAGIAEQEFAFTTKKIEENFSNYSAWHQRSALLGERIRGDAALAAEELELAKNAIFCESKDSAAWLYILWLVGQCPALAEPALECTMELYEIERKTPARGCLVVAARLMKLLGKPQAEYEAMIQRAIEVDPLRSGYYRDVLAGKAS